MAVVLEVSMQGQQQLARLMSRLDPKRHGVKWLRRGLERAGKLVHVNATQKQIRRGGATKKGASRPILGVLTSRTGTYRRSIRVDRGPLPHAIDVGTDLKYGAVHEIGGPFSIPRHRVSAHTRTMAFGRKVSAYSVGPFSRGPYSARFPKRPSLVPALDEVTPEFPRIFVEEIEKVLGAKP